MGAEVGSHSTGSSIVLRWIRFIGGVCLIALGIALSIRSGLGATPISTIPTVLAEVTPLTVGTYLIMLNMVFVLLQILLLRRRFPPFQLIQIPVTVVFGMMCDAALWATTWIAPTHYLEHLFWVCVSVVVIAVGVYIEVLAKIAYLPGDGIVFTLHQVSRARFGGVRFGTVKQLFDLTLVLLAILLGLILIGEVFAVREGTVISALGVGAVVKVIERLHSRWLVRRNGD